MLRSNKRYRNTIFLKRFTNFCVSLLVHNALQHLSFLFYISYPFFGWTSVVIFPRLFSFLLVELRGPTIGLASLDTLEISGLYILLVFEHVYMRSEVNSNQLKISNRFEMLFCLYGNLRGDFTVASFQTIARPYCTIVTATTSVHLPKPVLADLTIKPDSVLTKPIGKDGVQSWLM